MKDAVWETRFVPRPVAIVRPRTRRIFQNIHQVEILLSSHWFLDTFARLLRLQISDAPENHRTRMGHFVKISRNNIDCNFVVLPY